MCGFVSSFCCTPMSSFVKMFQRRCSIDADSIESVSSIESYSVPFDAILDTYSDLKSHIMNNLNSSNSSQQHRENFRLEFYKREVSLDIVNPDYSSHRVNLMFLVDHDKCPLSEVVGRANHIYRDFVFIKKYVDDDGYNGYVKFYFHKALIVFDSDVSMSDSLDSYYGLPLLSLSFDVSKMSDLEASEYCCKMRCFKIPECQVDGVACRKCRSFSYCTCRCVSRVHYRRS